MNVVSLVLPTQALDAFVYAGHLWVVGRDHAVRVLPLQSLVAEICAKFPDYETAYQLAFVRNDWLTNAQAQTVFADPSFRGVLEKLWRGAGEQPQPLEHVAEWREVAELPLLNLQDCRFYAMTAYFAGREGVFEGGIDVNERSGEVHIRGGVERVFDAPVVALSAKAGELAMSAGAEGLFHGTIGPGDEPLDVDQRRCAHRSIRTTWTGWDVVNYSGQFDFEYLRNDWDKVPTGAPRHFRFSEEDEAGERVRITSFASTRFGVEAVGIGRLEEWSRAVFFQSTNRTGVMVLDDNSCLWLNWRIGRDGSPFLSVKRQQLPRVGTSRNLGAPISMSPLSSGYVIEYFDRSYLVSQDGSQVLENRPAIAVRTFPASRRFRQLVLIVREDGVSLHAVLPASPAEVGGLSGGERARRRGTSKKR